MGNTSISSNFRSHASCIDILLLVHENIMDIEIKRICLYKVPVTFDMNVALPRYKYFHTITNT